jgi:release factor glutamine methyltransferase
MTRRELTESIVTAAKPVYGAREAAAVARLVAERRYGLSHANVALEPRATVDEGAGFAELLAEIASARPVQYILGMADFCGMELAVGEGALIPRPETEELVRWIALDLAAAKHNANTEAGRNAAEAEDNLDATAGRNADTPTVGCGQSILDIGTGSGAIAIALARQVTGARVTAIDISADALRYARLNNERTGAGVKILQADALDPALDAVLGHDTYDVIVSNPPYIPLSERAAMDRNVVEHEPAGALFVPDGDPLLFYRAIAKFARRALRPGGALYFEIHEGAAETMPPMLAAEGFAGVEVREDINEKPRMVKATVGVKQV